MSLPICTGCQNVIEPPSQCYHCEGIFNMVDDFKALKENVEERLARLEAALDKLEREVRRVGKMGGIKATRSLP